MSPSVSVSISISRPVVYGMIRCKLSVYLTNAHSLPSIENSVLQYEKSKFLFHSLTVSCLWDDLIQTPRQTYRYAHISPPIENPVL